MAEFEEREKQWLEKEDTAKGEELKSHLPASVTSNQAKNHDNNEIERDVQHVQSGRTPTFKSHNHFKIKINEKLLVTLM